MLFNSVFLGVIPVLACALSYVALYLWTELRKSREKVHFLHKEVEEHYNNEEIKKGRVYLELVQEMNRQNTKYEELLHTSRQQTVDAIKDRDDALKNLTMILNDLPRDEDHIYVTQNIFASKQQESA